MKTINGSYDDERLEGGGCGGWLAEDFIITARRMINLSGNESVGR